MLERRILLSVGLLEISGAECNRRIFLVVITECLHSSDNRKREHDHAIKNPGAANLIERHAARRRKRHNAPNDHQHSKTQPDDSQDARGFCFYKRHVQNGKHDRKNKKSHRHAYSDIRRSNVGGIAIIVGIIAVGIGIMTVGKAVVITMTFVTRSRSPCRHDNDEKKAENDENNIDSTHGRNFGYDSKVKQTEAASNFQKNRRQKRTFAPLITPLPTRFMKTVEHFNFSGKKVLIRVDFNVPLNASFAITDDTRMRAAIPTIKKILGDGGSCILMSHLGRPKEGPAEKFSLKHLVAHLSELLGGATVHFASDCIGAPAETAAAALKNGEVLLLENLRFHKEEEKGDVAFAKALASLGDFYVNDAFGTAHRSHASTAVIAQFFPGNKCFGYVMHDELAGIDKVLNGAEKPFTAIMGGAKVSDKILILAQLMKKADNIIIGGGMAFTFVKAQGGTIGKSLVEDDRLQNALEILADAKKRGVNIYIPTDAVCADNFSNDANRQTCSASAIPDGWMGLDIGPETEKTYAAVIRSSKTILWNGPMGVFEMENFAHGTKIVADAIVDATAAGAYSLVGGGDSVAAINKYKLSDKVSYVSTGGGAMLEYIEAGTLPGVEAVNERATGN